ncbi:hypothetical protein [Noviherbaspirillum pedocola]|uniref:Uncharacterized protein n=1 Tax=Noviherbaspirillum pedocola TaxID=2801341 RepID=A0A934W6P0_9BURK|nr:hypothetical protein [Noviherbaspirillum pedocola]MBK4734593.1 hypothetical protein [Noviherbaspirillum pedocola]
MAQLSVGTETTPLELAAFFRQLDANDTVGGKQGNDGELVLYVNPGGRSRRLLPSLEERTVTRVAVEVVLQPLSDVAGAELALRHVQSALQRPNLVRVGDVSGPLGVLADLYGQSVKNSAAHVDVDPKSVGTWSHFVRETGLLEEGHGGAASPEGHLSEEQSRIVTSLLEKLRRLPGASSNSE